MVSFNKEEMSPYNMLNAHKENAVACSRIGRNAARFEQMSGTRTIVLYMVQVQFICWIDMSRNVGLVFKSRQFWS